MAAVTLCSDFGAPQNEVCHSFHFFLIYLPWSDGTRCNDLLFFECWSLNQLFHFPLSLSSRGSLVLHFCQKGGIISMSEVIDISPSILIPVCASSSPAFRMMYSAYKLNKQSDYIQPWRTPSPLWNQSIVSFELALGIPICPTSWASLLPPSSLGCYRALVWVSWATQQIPIGYLFYI